VQGVFTRIRSGATAVASYGGALGSTIFSTVAARTGSDSWLDLLGMAARTLENYSLRPSRLLEAIHLDYKVLGGLSYGPLPRWVPGPTTRWAPRTTRLALHDTCWREAQGLQRRSTRIGRCTCPTLYRGLLDVLD
jgi:hypothetical protein